MTPRRSERLGTGESFIVLDQAEALLVKIALYDALIDLDRLLIGKTAEQIASVEPFRQSLTTLHDRIDQRFTQARAKGSA